MSTTNPNAFVRPQHAYDLPRAAVWLLAAAGQASLSLAHSLDAALTRAAEVNQHVDRPRARLGPSQTVHARHLIPDSWRVR
jgi:hypothetical protein